MSFLFYWSIVDEWKYFRLQTYFLYTRDSWKYLSRKLISVFAENQKANPRWFLHYGLLTAEKYNTEVVRSFIIYIYFQY